MGGQTALGVEAPRLAGVGVQAKAQAPDQGRMFDQELAQSWHALFAFLDFDQVGGDKGGAPFGPACVPVP